jgi:hypothetical protein
MTMVMIMLTTVMVTMMATMTVMMIARMLTVMMTVVPASTDDGHAGDDGAAGDELQGRHSRRDRISQRETTCLVREALGRGLSDPKVVGGNVGEIAEGEITQGSAQANRGGAGGWADLNDAARSCEGA